MKKAYTAATAVTPTQVVHDAVLIIEDGKIAAFGARDHLAIPAAMPTQDFGANVLAPGFVDIHIHGGAGRDVMEGDPSALEAIERHLMKSGVTSYLPTTVTAPIDKTLSALEKLGRAVRAGRQLGRTTPLGVHLEGPFISTAKCGVHPAGDIVPPSLDLFRRFREAAQNTIKIMTVAPETKDAAAFIQEATSAGVCVSLGHSDATTASAREAVRAGATHATHTFNAMRALDHREPGILGVVLAEDQLTADIIIDGVHVAPETVKLFLAAKADDRAVLITDAISATGMGDGRYRLGTFEVEVKGDRCLLNGRLAGSVLRMDVAIRNVMKIAAWSLPRATRLATLNPARVIGVDEHKGSLAVGKDADLVVLTPGGEVITTIVGGEPA